MTPLEEIRSLFSELLGWKGEMLFPVDFALATVLSTFLPGDTQRCWGELCGPPASGKSTIISAIGAYRRAVEIQDVTENAFASAFRDEKDPKRDNSLICRLEQTYENKEEGIPKGPKFMCIHEMSPIYCMRRERGSGFMASLRSAFDGHYGRVAGNIGMQQYKTAGFGLLLGGTEVGDDIRRENQLLGERTMLCRTGDRVFSWDKHRERTRNAGLADPVADQAIKNRLRAVLRSSFDKIIPKLMDGKVKVERTAELSERYSDLAHILAVARTVPRGPGRFQSKPEEGARVVKQLHTWGSAHAVLDDRTRWTERDYQMMRRIAQDTLMPELLRVLQVNEIARRAKLDRGVAMQQLSQWELFDLTRRGNSNSSFGLTQKAADELYTTDFLSQGDLQ